MPQSGGRGKTTFAVFLVTALLIFLRISAICGYFACAVWHQESWNIFCLSNSRSYCCNYAFQERRHKHLSYILGTGVFALNGLQQKVKKSYSREAHMFSS